MSDAKDENEKSEAPSPAAEAGPPAASEAPSGAEPEAKAEAEPEPKAEAEPAPEAETAEPKAEAAEPAAPKKKKKKKKKPADTEGGGEALPEEVEPALDVTGAERPAFHAWFPRDEELQALVRAFEVGNYALVRERAPKLAQNAESEKVRAAARELMARIEPDPLMKYLLLAATLLLVFLAFYAYRAHGH